MENTSRIIGVALIFTLAACWGEEPKGLLPAGPAKTQVVFDIFHRPLPEIPLPNDIATRHDKSSPTGVRINASYVAPTTMEARARRNFGTIDGWGVSMPITVPFSGELDVNSILAGHRDVDYAFANDVVYLVNVDRKSEHFGELVPLDMGEGNYPVFLEDLNQYWKNDPRGDTVSLIFEEYEEDLNGNGLLDPGEDLNGNGMLDAGEDLDGDGVLDPPEDTDADGLLDHPNYFPGANPDRNDLAARADATMTFYDRQSHTLIAKPLVPLRERTKYAFVVTRRLLDVHGEPVGSPFEFVNHTSQTSDLRPLLDVMPEGLAPEEIAFAFSFTTQTITSEWIALREGIYGRGVQGHLAEEFPPRVEELSPMRDEGEKDHLIYAEDWKNIFGEIAEFVIDDAESSTYDNYLESLRYVDYIVSGTFKAPILFPREDVDGRPLPLDDQIWPADLTEKAAKAYEETLHFTLFVPRKEVSARGEGKPAPVTLLGHGYGSGRVEALIFGPYLARHGQATLAIDGPSSGVELDEITYALLESKLRRMGFEAAAKAIGDNSRAWNQDNDPLNKKDSGSDFWTAYIFHTRDMVRQFALDYMSLIRLVRSFDGSRTWAHDVNGDGEPNDLAGDFDGDGIVDIGEGSAFGMTGGSLGGIMTMTVAAIEPAVNWSAPISGGAMLTEVGLRTRQGGARQGFALRVMAPVITGQLTDDVLNLETIVPYNNNSERTLPLGSLEGVKPWDTILVTNLRNGELGCAFVQENGTMRTGVASNVGDRLLIEVFAGPQIVGEDCELRTRATRLAVRDTFGETLEFGYDSDQDAVVFEQGSPLVALAEGFGFARATSSLRRFMALGQIAMDRGDPIAVARHLLDEPLVYPGGESTGGHALVIATLGDVSVPPSTSMAYARAAGIIDYKNVDPNFAVPLNQALIDLNVGEGNHNYKRFTFPNGQGVHLDVHNFSDGLDEWGTDLPRLDPPLRAGFEKKDALGGYSAPLFILSSPTGSHGFTPPGTYVDDARSNCKDACTETGDNPCGCATLEVFDMGRFMFNFLGVWGTSGGKTIADDRCMGMSEGCEGDNVPPPPEFRDPTTLH